MLTKNITINYRWRSSLIYLLIIASIVSVFTGITTTSQSASAATVTQAKHCIATYYAGSKSGYEIAKRPAGSGSWIDETNGDFNKNSCGDVCTTKTSSRNVPSVGNEQYSVIVQCSTDSKGGGCPGCGPVGTTPPGADTANGAIYDGYNQVVLDKYCPASMSNQIDCITKVNQDTIICIPGDATSAAIDFNTVAKCLEKNSPSSPKITASVIEPLLKKAQASVQSDADSAVAKSKCEKDGSNTWDPTANGGKGTCVSSSGNGQSTCQVDGIGWIICPVMNFMAKVVNAVYSVVSDMLTTPAINTNTNDSNNALYQTWSSFRNIANIAFVVAFLIIIYSQITSVGITNYGIKKMLPRIIIAAILVNVSYWICAIAIDLSNIVGSSVVGLFNGITPKTTSTGSNFNGGNGVINWVGGTAAVLAVVGVALYAGLTVLLPIIITAVVAILTVVIVLTARQAIIILLVAVAPLAFVAFLLPNTEKWFKKWRETFVAMLVMFPVIAAVFGASKLASAVIMKTAGDNVTLQIMGAGVSIIPLIISPIVMKASTGILGKIGGYVNNPNKGPFDRMRKGAEGARERALNRRATRAMNNGRVFGGGQFRRKAKREAIDAGLKGERSRASQQYVADQMSDDDGNETRFAKRAAGGTMFNSPDQAAVQRSLAGAQFTIEKAEIEDVKAANAIIAEFPANQLHEILNDDKSSAAQKAAALNRLVTISDPQDYEDYVNKYGADDSKDNAIVRRTMADALKENGPKFLKAADIDTIRTGQLGKARREKDGSIAYDRDENNEIRQDANGNAIELKNNTNLAQIAKSNVKAGTISQESMVADNNGNLMYAWNNADDEGRAILKQTANALKNNRNLSGKIKHNQQAINEIAGTTPDTSTASNSTASTSSNNPPTNTVGGGNTLTVTHDIPAKPSSNTINTTNITRTNINNTENITNKPNINQSFPGTSTPARPSTGSVDASGRFTPGGVTDADDYHDGMQK